MANELSSVQQCRELLLAGYVDRKAVRRVLRTIRRQLRQRPRTHFCLNCTLVEDFCGYALADFIDLRRRLQWQGADLQLVGCSPQVKSRLVMPLFESLVVSEPSRRHSSPIALD